MGASWGELRVGTWGALTLTVPSLAGEVGWGRGQARPWLEWQSEICFTVSAVGMPPLWIQLWYFQSSRVYCLTFSGEGPSMVWTLPGASDVV